MHFIFASIYEGFRRLVTCFQLFYERTEKNKDNLSQSPQRTQRFYFFIAGEGPAMKNQPGAIAHPRPEA